MARVGVRGNVSLVVAASKAALTTGSRSSKRPQRGSSSCSLSTGSGGGEAARAAGLSAASMASKTAQQATELASGPTLSRVYESGKAPSRGTRAAVGLKPVVPQSAEGMRTEPRVSEPRDMAHMPSATATAAPDEEPPGMRPPEARSHGFFGVPY